MSDAVTTAAAMIFGIGAGVAPLVFAAVSVIRGMLLGSDRRRRVIIPAVGIVLGWIFTGLILAIVAPEISIRNVAVVLLGGFWAYAVSAGLAGQARDARPSA